MVENMQNLLSELFDIARTLSSTLDVDTLLKRIGVAAEKLTDSEASSIMLVDEERKHLLFKIATGEKSSILKKMKVNIGEGIAGTIALTKESLTINDVSKDKRFAVTFDKSSGFQTKSILGVPLLLEGEVIGVAEVLNKRDGKEFTDEDKAILTSLASLASVSIANAKLIEDQKNFFIYMIEVVVEAVEARDPKMMGHTWRVAQTATAIARLMEFDEVQYKNVYYGALLHDIGYLLGATATNIGQGIITVQQQDLEKTHPVLGWQIINKINILRGAAPLVRAHHENFDGSGFPDKLQGENIPLGSNIIALSEYIDELKISGNDAEKILELVRANSGKRFYPDLVDLYANEVHQPDQEHAYA